MSYSTFNKKSVNAMLQPMFFGEPVNVARYDQQAYPVFEKLIDTQLSFFWRPEEVDLSLDRKDFMLMPEHERHIFLSNLKYQILLDSVQGRSPNAVFLPVCSLPELETWIETWSFSETVHSRSYTHIIRNIVNDPGLIFDDIMVNEMIMKRAESVTKLYDDFFNRMTQNEALGREYSREDKTVFIKLMMSVNILEAIRFYVSFACSFAFGERKIMEGNAKIIKLIARDEALHKGSTQQILKIWRDGHDGLEMAVLYNELLTDGTFDELFDEAVAQEEEWSDYLFKDGSMIGLSSAILKQYLYYVADKSREQLSMPKRYGSSGNPLPWMSTWLTSDNVQIAPQESEKPDYLTASLDNDIGDADFKGFGFD